MARLRNLAIGGRDIALYGSANLVRPAIALAMIPVFTRLFVPEDYGIIGIYTVIVGLLTTVLSANGQIYVLWNRAKLGKAQSVAAVGATMRIATAGSLLCLAASAVWWLIAAPDSVPFWVAIVAIGTAWATVWILLDTHVHQADEEARAFFTINATTAVIGPIATVVLAVGVVSNWTARIGGIAIAAAVVGAWSASSLMRRDVLRIGGSQSMVRPVLRFGLPLLPHTVGLWIAASVDRFIIAAMVGIASTGIYTVAASIALAFAAVHDGVSRFFAPLLSRWTADGSVEGQVKAARFAYSYSAAALVSAPLLILVTVPIARWILPDDYATVTDFLMWLIVAQAFAGIARIFTGYLYAASWTGVLSAVTLITAAAGLLFTVAMVSSFGAIGAAVAAVGTALIRALATYLVARRTGLLCGIADTIRPAHRIS